MTYSIQLKQSNFVKYLFYYFIVLLVSNYIKTDYLINSLIENNINIALISGHLSSIVSSIFVFLLFIIIVSISIFVKDIFFNKISNESIFEAIKNVIIAFIFIEITRLILMYFTLYKEINDIDIHGDIKQQLYDTNWYHLNSIINIFVIIYGALIFGMVIYIKERKIIPAIIFCIVFLSCFYLTNINILDLL